MNQDIILLAILSMLVDDSSEMCIAGPPDDLPYNVEACWRWKSSLNTYVSGFEYGRRMRGTYTLDIGEASTDTECSFNFSLYYSDKYDLLMCY